MKLEYKYNVTVKVKRSDGKVVSLHFKCTSLREATNFIKHNDMVVRIEITRRQK